MNKTKQKKGYSAPKCEIVQVNETTNLMDTSFPSQHRPAHHGSTISSAKASVPWETDEKKDEENPSWED